MSRNRVCAVALVALLAACAPRAQATYLADYTSHVAVDNRVVFQCGVPAVVVEFVDERVCRVSLYPVGLVADDSSLAVLPRTLAPVAHTVEVGADTITIRTASITVLCQKRPFRLHVCDAAGNHLLDEPNSGGMAWNASARSFQFAIGADHLYGLGERATSFDRRGQYLGTYNQAFYGYGPSTPTMNLNIPFLTSSRGWGLLFDNPWPGSFDLASSTAGVLAGSAESGPLRLYFIQGPDLKAVLERYTWLTGRPPLPPRWALGYLQSKYGYRSRYEVETLVGQFRTNNIPLDAVILDLYWYGQPSDMGRMTWDTGSWPGAGTMVSNLLQTGVRTVLIEEPYLITSTANYASAAAQGFIGKTSGGAPYPFSMWAGTAGLVDFTQPAAADWWWNLHRPLLAQGVAGWWLDLGEPETHPDDLVHSTGPARSEHDVYNLRWLQSLYDRQRADRPNQRVFLLTRSGYAGMQRTGAVSWSGDVQKTFPDLAVQVPMLLGMGLSGVGWHNSDIGGYAGTTTAELYTRWMQFGAFCPLTRAHGSGQDTAPWAYGTTAQAICQKFLQLRQRLIPYSYTLARENTLSGLPLARPLLLEYPLDAQAPLISDEYMWGSSFLVAPVTDAGATSRSIYLPAGHWTNYWSNQVLSGPQTVVVSAPLDQMPLLVRSGSIVPMQNGMPSSASFALDTLTLDIFPADTASFTLYEDDGASCAYETGASANTALSFGTGGRAARIHIGSASGSYAGQPASRTWIAQVRHVMAAPAAVSAAGVGLAVRADSTALAGNASGWWYDAAGSRVMVKLRLAATQSTDIVIDSVRIAGVLETVATPPLLMTMTADPNPVRDLATLRFSMPAGDMHGIRLEIFDLRGRRIADLSRTLRVIGNAGTAEIRTRGLSQGIYYVRLHAGHSEGRLELVVLH